MLAVSSTVDIDRQQVLTHIGYGDDYEPSGRIGSLVNEYIDNAHNLVASSYSYTFKDIESVQGNRVIIEGGITLESGVIASLLRRCDKVAIFVLSIGNHLEDMVAHLAENNLVLQATVLDAIGSNAAEQLAGFVEDRVKRLVAPQGLYISRRYSPGYCDWELGQQQMVFRAMQGDTAGVRLTEGCLMLPRKSVSGIIGIGQCADDIVNYNPCNVCRKEECPGRR